MRPVLAQDLLIGHTVMRERLRKGITQNEVARAVGVSLRTLQSWEAGRDPVPAIRRPALAAALGIPATALDMPDIEPLTADERAALTLYRRIPRRLRAWTFRLLNRLAPKEDALVDPA